jgi:hypothetical protein
MIAADGTADPRQGCVKFAIRYQSASTVPPVNCMLPDVY